MKGLPLDVLTWQATVASADGPDAYTMRLVLLALSARMLNAGTNSLRVTGSELALATGLSRPWAMQMALEAVRTGWLTRKRAAGWHQGWQAFEYQPALPASPCRFHVAHGRQDHRLSGAAR